MDFHLKQWRTETEADERQSAKIPKLLLNPQHLPETASSGLNLFLPLPHTVQMTIGSGSSPFPDLASPSARFCSKGIGSYFSVSQLQELELQALIFRYMVSGAPVPAELLLLIKKSLLHAPYFLHYPHWVRRDSMDPEPGRCRRTDGKKWRCSREVVGGQKYCERHVHRGRNRSRKPVEVSAPGSAASGGRINPVSGGYICRIGSNTIAASQPLNSAAAGTRFTPSELSPTVDLFNLHASSAGPETEIKGLVAARTEVAENSCKLDGHVLRHFFDDWPRSLEETGNAMPGGHKIQINSPTCLSITLKLSTENAGEQRGLKDVSVERNQEEPPLSWSAIPTGQMGGPLAEALQPSSVTSFVGA